MPAGRPCMYGRERDPHDVPVWVKIRENRLLYCCSRVVDRVFVCALPQQKRLFRV